jgi:hypothetical protein
MATTLPLGHGPATTHPCPVGHTAERVSSGVPHLEIEIVVVGSGWADSQAWAGEATRFASGEVVG